MESEFKGVEWAFPVASPEKPVSCSGGRILLQAALDNDSDRAGTRKHPTPHCPACAMRL